MFRSRWMPLLVVLVAVLLHLPVQIASGRADLLPEDGPALIQNPSFAPGPGESWRAPLSRAVRDPASAWWPGGAEVGRARWRPVSGVLFVAERWAGGGAAGRAASLVALLLHCLVVWQTMRLCGDLGGARGSSLLAGLLVACSPAAFPAAAWPARHAVVLAAALGVTGVRAIVCGGGSVHGGGSVRGGARLELLGGVLLALAGLAHEFAFGLLPAALAIRLLAAPGSRSLSWRGALRFGALPTLALIGRWAVLSSAESLAAAHEVVTSGGPRALDAPVGALVGLAGLLVPGRLHFADGPWQAGVGGRVAAAVVLLGVLWALWGARRQRWAIPALAALAAASPLLGLGAVGGAPFHTGYLYAALPLGAVALAMLFAAAHGRPGLLRPLAATAAVLLVVCTGVVSAHWSIAFRSRSALVRRARADMPGSPVVAAWALGVDLVAAERAGKGRSGALAALGPRVRALADETRPGEDGHAVALAGDGVAATTVGIVLGRYARSLATSPVPDGDPHLLAAETAGEAATRLLPGWAGSWSTLAHVRTRLGAREGAFDAAARAHDLEPRSVQLAALAASLAVQLGRTEEAVERIEVAAVLDREAAARRGRPPSRDVALLRARALSADASRRGFPWLYESAAAAMEDLAARGDEGSDLLQLRYAHHLRWADYLASSEKPAMALIAYGRAVALGGPKSAAAERRGQLEDRLRDELRRSEELIASVVRGEASPDEGNLADAFLGLAVAHCRLGEWGPADEAFGKLVESAGRPALAVRYAIALHRHASRVPDGLAAAETEFRRVLDEEPRMVEARYRLAHVLLEQRRFDEAQAEFERAASEGAGYEWSVKALKLAAVLAAGSGGERR